MSLNAFTSENVSRVHSLLVHYETLEGSLFTLNYIYVSFYEN